MKKIFKNKIVQLGLALGVGAGIFSLPLITHASDTNNSYFYHIYSYQINTRDDYAYRETGSVDNPWKVRLTSSTESKDSKSITRFWLENKKETNVSASVNKLEGDPASYMKPYSSANKTYVYLTAENNNYNLEQYSATGYWDEETW
ncbi:DUF2712 domain-containing protein [Priestia sp. J2]|uniref:DUF2712 domain-containing protein n=1 Tax=unclassified Priestia TaxID=2800374 RepID=UPI001E432109|nr:DUF2712 domain-containing protein [Priestia sp. J2]